MQDIYLYLWKISHFSPSWINKCPFCSLKTPGTYLLRLLITLNQSFDYLDFLANIWVPMRAAATFHGLCIRCSAQGVAHEGCSIEYYLLLGFLLSSSIFFLPSLALVELPPPLPGTIPSPRYCESKLKCLQASQWKPILDQKDVIWQNQLSHSKVWLTYVQSTKIMEAEGAVASGRADRMWFVCGGSLWDGQLKTISGELWSRADRFLLCFFCIMIETWHFLAWSITSGMKIYIL